MSRLPFFVNVVVAEMGGLSTVTGGSSSNLRRDLIEAYTVSLELDVTSLRRP